MSILGNNGPKAANLFLGGKLPLTPFVGNKNLLSHKQKLNSAFHQQIYSTIVPRRQEHQLLFTLLYNKLVLLHLTPGPNTATI